MPPKIFSVELEDLSLMLIHLQAVHSGADLESAIANCMGYKTEVMLSTGYLVLLLCNFHLRLCVLIIREKALWLESRLIMYQACQLAFR